MKKIYFLGIALGFCAIANAQNDYVEPIIVPDDGFQRVSPYATFAGGQDLMMNTVTYDIKNKKEYIYYTAYPGTGNFIANNGMAVGEDNATDQHALVMFNGERYIPKTLANIGTSSLTSITPDASRACGWYQNTGLSGPTYIPFYVDIDANGEFGKPVALPYPRTDFFKDVPQFIIAQYISDDGKTIAGYLRDSSGFYSYPLIYRQDDNGDWSYTFPTEALFNPDNLPLPTWPNIKEPPKPQLKDYMSDEEWAAYQEALKSNPSVPYWNYMTDQEYKDYEWAISDWTKEVAEASKPIDEYWQNMWKVGKNECFDSNLVLSADGKYLLASTGITSEETTSDDYSFFQPYLFDLENNTYEKVETEVALIPHQILQDGTLVTITDPYSFMPYVCYVKLPEDNEFIPFTQYLEESRFAGYLPWLEDTLGVIGGVIGYDPITGEAIYGDYVITGTVSFSNDMVATVGGYYIGGECFSYIFYDENAEVNEVSVDNEEVFTVYNLNGVKVLSTKDKNEVNNLPKGIYIVNGKKIAI